MNSQVTNMNCGFQDLVVHIFTNNANQHMMIGIESIHNNKQLFSFCFQLLCSGLVMLYGDGKKLQLNKVTMDQLECVKNKMKYAQIKLKTIMYDYDTAVMLDMVPEENVNEMTVLSRSMAMLNEMGEDNPLDEYTITLYLNDCIMQLYFEIST